VRDAREPALDRRGERRGRAARRPGGTCSAITSVNAIRSRWEIWRAFSSTDPISAPMAIDEPDPMQIRAGT
jgi:hypothetical protein